MKGHSYLNKQLLTLYVSTYDLWLPPGINGLRMFKVSKEFLIFSEFYIFIVLNYLVRLIVLFLS